MRKQLIQLCLILLCYGYSIAQPSKMATYQNRAASLLLNGQYEEAIQALELAADAHKATEQWPNYFSCLNQITNAYLSLQNYVEAKRMAKETLWESISIMGRDNNESAKSAHQLAEVYSLAGRFSKAEEYHLMGLNIRKSINGDAHPDVADSYCKLAKNLEREKKYKEAEESYQLALALQKKLLGEDHSFVGNTLYALGALSTQKDDLKAAKSYHLQALEIREKTYGQDHHRVAQSYFALSQIDEIKSAAYLKSAADIYVLELSEVSIDAAVCLFQYSKQLFNNGMFKNATPYAQKSVGIFNVIGRKNALAGAANHLMGALLYEGNAPNKAIKYFEQAIHLGYHPPLTYHLLINTHHQLGQHTQALVWAEKYFNSARSEKATTDALLLMAENQLANKDWEAAQNTLNKINRSNLSTEANIYITLYESRLQSSQQNFDALINLPELSIPPNHSVALAALEIELLRAKAATRLAQQGRSEISLLKKAYQKYDELHQAIFVLLSRPLSALNRQQLDVLQSEIYDEAIGCSYLLYEQTQKINYVHAAFAFSERSKVVHLSLYAQHNHLNISVPTSLRQELAHIAALDHHIKDKWLNDENSTTLEEEQAVLIRKYDTQLAQFGKEFPEAFSILFQPEIVSAETFNLAFASEGMYTLSYFVGKQLLYVFTIKEGEMSISQRERSLELNNKIEEFSRLCQHPPHEQSADELNRSFRSFIHLATSLKETLVPVPINPSPLEEEPYSLLILPHGSLAYFPFEALCFEEENVSNFSQASFIGKYMVTHYHYSASNYMQENSSKSNEWLLDTEQTLHIPYRDEQSLSIEQWNKQDTSSLLINRFANEQVTENLVSDFLTAIHKSAPAHKALQYARSAYLQKNINQPLNAHPYYWAGYCFIGKPTNDYVFGRNNFPYWILAAVGGIVLVGLWVRKK